MERYCLILCFVAFCISACTWKKPGKSEPAITIDTLTYSYKTFKQRAADCGSKTDSNCTIVKFVYPVFNGQKELNDSVTHQLLALSPGEKPDTSLSATAKTFLNNYKLSSREAGNSVPFNLNGNIKIIRQDSSLVTLQVYGYSFEGGAHPSSYTTFFNWNTKLKKKITLWDLFKDGAQEYLRIKAEAIFRQNEKLSTEASLANNYFFKDNKFALNDNFAITPAGLRFLYNQYEIKPYSAGVTNLLIPYLQIKTLLRPNTVVAQYIK
jgi:hypothetical protein